MLRPLDVTASTLASSLRGWRGTVAYRPAARQPEKPLELYEYEDCPFCRLVREALTELDLDAMVYPCPKDGTRFRPRVKELGGKLQFPFLVDPNTGAQMYESEDIIAYLRKTYAERTTRHNPLRRGLQVASSSLASGLRWPRGLKAKPSRAPEKPLELYSFESSPFSRLVRETLCEMEIPYLLRNTGKGQGTDMGPPWVRDAFFKNVPMKGRNRLRLRERAGRVQLPYLIDPNTGTEMFESAAIKRYLLDTYGA